MDEKDKYDEWHKDPKNWILGVIYYNKEDKRIFPPKRFKGLGWTVNFAHPASIFVFIFILLAVLVAIFATS